MSSTMEVGKKLVEMCRAGKLMECIETMYSPNIVSVEAAGPPNTSLRTEGIEAIRGKNKWWEENHQVHTAQVDGPYPNGDRFIVRFKFDVTAKTGPMTGQRFVLDEDALYTVKDGKIVHEEFFYSMG